MSSMHAAGHSLGGALATLAAYDIRKQLLNNKQSNSKVVCCTFAAPRTGNHAFAREYNAMVPDTWSVINDQVTPLTAHALKQHTPACQCMYVLAHQETPLEPALILGIALE